METRRNKKKDDGYPTEQPLWFKNFADLMKKHNEYVLTKLKDIEKKIDVIDELKEEVKGHQTRLLKIEEKHAQLDSKLAQLDSKSREKNIVIQGLEIKGKSSDGKTLAESVQRWIFRSLQIEAKVDEAFKIGTQKVKLILVKFSSVSSVRAVFRKGVLQKLQGMKISIRPDLSPEIRQARSPWYPTLNKLKREGRKVYFRGVQLFCDGKVVESFSADLEVSKTSVKARYANSGPKGMEEDEDLDAPLVEEEDTE